LSEPRKKWIFVENKPRKKKKRKRKREKGGTCLSVSEVQPRLSLARTSGVSIGEMRDIYEKVEG